ncbi:hypothetical protein P7K49_023131 [Saguinus oedipus]|uniref:3-beta hydroxysteroid dehydrogenase/isomerase domain-containing protein n=1 Tax=Saguinus oedipus TaxID=9490 RepID=A0ABQ9ULK0_SAGOE|nr:hypothetical protein P7K49_023131 [Saguinus oedipus]
MLPCVLGGGILRTCVLRPPGIYGPEEQRHLPRVAVCHPHLQHPSQRRILAEVHTGPALPAHGPCISLESKCPKPGTLGSTGCPHWSPSPSELLAGTEVSECTSQAKAWVEEPQSCDPKKAEGSLLPSLPSGLPVAWMVSPMLGAQVSSYRKPLSKGLPEIQGHIKKRLFMFRFGDRKAQMNWVHVHNLVQAHVLAAKALTVDKGYVASGQAYYINDGESVNLFEWMAPLFEKLGYSQPRIQVPTSWVYLTAAVMEHLHLALRPICNLPPLLTRSEGSLVNNRGREGRTWGQPSHS